jgi:hypothetical protein
MFLSSFDANVCVKFILYITLAAISKTSVYQEMAFVIRKKAFKIDACEI